MEESKNNFCNIRIRNNQIHSNISTTIPNTKYGKRIERAHSIYSWITVSAHMEALKRYEGKSYEEWGIALSNDAREPWPEAYDQLSFVHLGSDSKNKAARNSSRGLFKPGVQHLEREWFYCWRNVTLSDNTDDKWWQAVEAFSVIIHLMSH